MSSYRSTAPALLVAGLIAAPHAPAANLGAALAFDSALVLAADRAPQLAAQRHAVRAAREMSVAAGELADPRLQLGAENVPAEGPDRGSLTGEAMTMRRIGLMQEFPAPGKLAARTERAQQMVGREPAALDVAAASIRRDVATAWLDRWLSERTVRMLRELEAEAQSQVELVTRGVAGGRVQAPDVIMARNNVLMIRDRITDAERESTRAVAMLERFIGDDARRPLSSSEVPDVSRLPQGVDDPRALAERHPELARAAREVDVARADVRLAELARRPDWNVEISYGIRGSGLENMVNLMVGIDLPIFPGSRQDRESEAKLARVDELRAQREAMVRMQEAEFKALHADWKAANEKLERFFNEILPLTRDRLWTTTASYGAGRAEINMVLDARTAYSDALVQQLTLEKERARVWAQLTYVTNAGDVK